MKRFTTEAFILKHTNYQDADRIYTFVSDDLGKFTALAKGVRKISSRRGGLLDSANKIKVSVSEGSTGFKTVSEVVLLDSYANIKNDFEKSRLVFYVLELLNRFLEEGSVAGVFNLVDVTLKNISSANDDRKSFLAVLAFEIRFMHLLGYTLNLTTCGSCDAPILSPFLGAKFDVSSGSLICSNCFGGFRATSDVINIMIYLNAKIFNLDNAEVPDFSLTNISSASDLVRSYIKEISGYSLSTDKLR
ncbi:DNA repair protein RecO [candidate division WWE3 bacterium]|uniref:DNA repair protein RecO n=1 Tax=candidate division WWE3 bacterium TaxID=2053526 RepID=A0A955EC36_UNCKA|nr:DNA repair protein RecO [candidate division WWE3 bacterium]MCB0367879.1 DNA repair protein RecO [Bdellovibrionales bacterium]